MLTKAAIFLTNNTITTVKLWNIITIEMYRFLFEYSENIIYSCDAKMNF